MDNARYTAEELQPMFQKVMEYFESQIAEQYWDVETCLLYTSPSPRDS